MLEVKERSEQDEAAATLTLPFDLRSRSRLRAALDDGREVAVLLPRGSLLRGGDRLRADDGTVIAVEAAAELVSTAQCPDALRFARACYHLGNRHVPLQIGEGWVRYLHDHVLDHMVETLGLTVRAELAPFEPEPGAYGEAAHLGHGHSHGAGHTHRHGPAMAGHPDGHAHD